MLPLTFIPHFQDAKMIDFIAWFRLFGGNLSREILKQQDELFKNTFRRSEVSRRV